MSTHALEDMVTMYWDKHNSLLVWSHGDAFNESPDTAPQFVRISIQPCPEQGWPGIAIKLEDIT